MIPSVVAALLLLAPQCARAEPEKPARRVLVVSVDGLRPDVMLRAQTPNMHALCERGSFTFWAQTVEFSYTLPAHVSMFTGVKPERHGVTWNNHIEGAYSQVPTLFQLAKKAGMTTAIAVAKTKFVALTPPDSLDWKFQPMDEPNTDAKVAAEAITILKAHKPCVMFVHFAGADDVGHAIGWGTPEQVAAVGKIDSALGDVLAELDKLKLRDSTLIILTADHGGMARAHDPNDTRSRFIPWIAAGPGVRKNLDLTTFPGFVVRVEDTFATACAFLGIDAGKSLDGRPVEQIFEKAQLLHDAAPKTGR
jgi:predicted AlkP superfamily pyrophosphatase or phosphodiesterase